MATLRDPEGVEWILDALCAVGRAPGAEIPLGDGRASAMHAALRWDGQRWTMRDLGSRNGTWVDGQRTGSAVLAEGTRLAFGDPERVWVLVDASPPSARAACGDEVRVGCGGVLLLPSEEAPEVAVVLRPSGWYVEREAQEAVAEGEVEAGGRTWTLVLPDVLPATAEGAVALSVAALSLRFEVSPDEEHVHILALGGEDGGLDLGVRAHHYLLLTLARARLRDRAAGAGLGEEGWEDSERLARRLGVTQNAFYVQTCRARAQLAELGVADAATFVERRAGGKIRIGVAAVEVVRV